MGLVFRNQRSLPIFFFPDHSDRSISFAVCFQVMIVGIKNALVQAIPYLYSINNLLNYVLLAVVAIVYLWSFVTNIHRFANVRPIVLGIVLFSILSMTVSSVLYKGNRSVIMEWLPRSLPYCIITFVYLGQLKTLRWIEYYMTHYCHIISIFTLISAIFIHHYGHITTSDWSTYSMPLSYVTLLAVMWELYEYFKRNRKAELLYALVGVVIIVLYGSRNPLLAIGAFFIIQMTIRILKNNTSTIKKMISILAILLLACGLFFLREIVLLAGDVLQGFGISSRTLSLFTDTSDFSTGRDSIHASLLDEIAKKPLTGLGVGGDVAVIDELSHGLYLSIIVSYGYIIGGLLILLICILCVKSLRKSDSFSKGIVLLYICMVLPRGFTGGDVWTSDVFWWMMGICITSLSIRSSEGIEIYDQSFAYY